MTMESNTTSRPVALITGASSGIGAALAKEYARRGYDLVILARRAERLEEVARQCRSETCKVEIVVGDAETEAERAVEAALRVFGRLDVAIANAGGGAARGPAESLEMEDYDKQLRLGIYAVVRLFRAAAKPLREREGRFAIINSIAGYIAPPGIANYAMAKAASRAFGNSVRNELRGGYPSITIAYPGYVDTEIWQVDKKGNFDPNLKPELPKNIMMTPEAAAKAIAHGVERRKGDLAFPLHAKMIIGLERYFPRLTAWILSRQPGAKE
jgi:short-subunit dehydrogenase